MTSAADSNRNPDSTRNYCLSLLTHASLITPWPPGFPRIPRCGRVAVDTQVAMFSAELSSRRPRGSGGGRQWHCATVVAAAGAHGALS